MSDKIEFLAVKGVKTFMGTDAPGYNATLMVNGKKAAEFVNDGGGGETRFRWSDPEAEKLFGAYVESLPLVDYGSIAGYNPQLIKPSDDCVVEELVERHLERKKILRLIGQRKLVWKTNTCRDSQYLVSRVPAASPAVLAAQVQEIKDNNAGDDKLMVANEDAEAFLDALGFFRHPRKEQHGLQS